MRLTRRAFGGDRYGASSIRHVLRARARTTRVLSASFAFAIAILALAACADSKPAAGSSDPVVARMIAAERAACACKTVACATAADRELAAWTNVYREDVARAVADTTREAQIDVHRGRADACRRALVERASPAELDALEVLPEDGADAAITKMGRIADKLCACRDMKCAEVVMREMSALKEPTSKPSKAQMENAMRIAEKMAACQKALMNADAPADLQESRVEVARSFTKKLAFEAYPQWAARPGNAGKCPTTSDLADYVNQQPALTDPWGTPYVIRCGADLPPGARGIAVLSAGVDGREGTADDLTSWEQ